MVLVVLSISYIHITLYPIAPRVHVVSNMHVLPHIIIVTLPVPFQIVSLDVIFSKGVHVHLVSVGSGSLSFSRNCASFIIVNTYPSL